MKVGSLFAGYGGIEMGLAGIFDIDVRWHVEFDAHASKVLEHNYPGTPNYGDITTVDWSSVEPVGLLCGGFPCQDISNAGKRKGIEGERSGLWKSYADCIGALRPRLVVVENVAALNRRGLDVVLGDLAALGFDAEWTVIRASEAGAPHRRERLFIVAHAADDGSERSLPGGASRFAGRVPEGRGPVAADAERVSIWEQSGRVSGSSGSGAVFAGSGGEAAADAPSHGRDERWSEPTGQLGGPGASCCGSQVWGDYADAIHRWEHVVCRRAPEPSVIGARGGRVLNPAFVEWMMGLPAGHVTDVPGLSRNNQLKILGNGVVPQQCVLAVRHLLAQAGLEDIA